MKMDQVESCNTSPTISHKEEISNKAIIIEPNLDILNNMKVQTQPRNHHHQHNDEIDKQQETHHTNNTSSNNKIKFSIDEILKKGDDEPLLSPPKMNPLPVVLDVAKQQQQQQPPILPHRYVPLSVPQYYADSDDSLEHEEDCEGQETGDGRRSSVTYVHNSGDDDEDDDDEGMDTGEHRQSGEGYSWLHCTRYKPPKLPRSKRKDTTKKRKLGRNPRVPFTQHQVSVLEQKFRQTHYLSSVDVAELSATLNLTETRVKIWFQNRRARERRDKNSPPVLEKELSSSHHSHSHFSEHIPDPSSPVSGGGGENRLLGKYPEEQLKAMGANPYNVNVLHTPWGNMYHTVHGLFGLRPLGLQYYDNSHQRALAQHRMLALQRHSAFTPVVHGVNGATNRSLPTTD